MSSPGNKDRPVLTGEKVVYSDDGHHLHRCTMMLAHAAVVNIPPKAGRSLASPSSGRCALGVPQRVCLDEEVARDGS